ncbi:GNAT family N-acetyltransferase [Paenibacillus sinopodophylli]|uniref:GNAT family N-acetyltransferase n=1 Tax=Paenibacillus sinopodophylli TaxID=1837342 RepID=UPI00110C930A|nr:GNAT family N-acetyltransferase [Paenibacillus sinopodophylli]
MIESAHKEDVEEVMPLLLAAIGHIAYTLAGTDDWTEAARILSGFYVREDNRISYKHVIVDRRHDGVAGMLLSYAGDGAMALDLPFTPRAGETIVVEARAGDYYLDSIAVDERYQGQGIAKALIAAYEEKGLEQGWERLSLIVEPNNDRAQALYKKLDFIEDGFIEVSGCRYIRMIKPLK